MTNTKALGWWFANSKLLGIKLNNQLSHLHLELCAYKSFMVFLSVMHIWIQKANFHSVKWLLKECVCCSWSTVWKAEYNHLLLAQIMTLVREYLNFIPRLHFVETGMLWVSPTGKVKFSSGGVLCNSLCCWTCWAVSLFISDLCPYKDASTQLSQMV